MDKLAAMNSSALLATPARAPLWNTHHDQPESRRRAIAALLNRQLADLIDLRLQAKQAHWNVKGPQFAALHLLFDEVAAAVDGLADEVAERAVVLGGFAGGTLQTIVGATRLPVYPPEIACGNDHSWAMSAALAQAARGARSAIRDAQDAGDDGSADVLTQVSRELDTLLWKVEAHVALEPR